MPAAATKKKGTKKKQMRHLEPRKQDFEQTELQN